MFATSIDPEFHERQWRKERLLATLDSAYTIAKWLPALANGEIRALRIPKWRSPIECAIELDAAEKLTTGAYAQEPTLAKGGPTVYDFEGRECDVAKYYAEAQKWNSAMRELFSPRATAQDKLLAILSETHSPGVIPEQLSPGHVPSTHVLRRFDVGSRGGPHIDRTDFDWPSNTHAATQLALFSAVTYLDVAKVGGELALYGDVFTRDSWLNAKLPNSLYEIDRKFLSPDPLVIAPAIGDLILFDARRAHEVRLIVTGKRVTSSCFFAWRGAHLPLGRYA